MPQAIPFTPNAVTLSLSVTQASTPGQCTGAGDAFANAAELNNDGGATCFVRWGSTAQTAVTTDYPVLAGQCKVISIPIGATFFAAICATGQSTTLRITPGSGA